MALKASPQMLDALKAERAMMADAYERNHDPHSKLIATINLKHYDEQIELLTKRLQEQGDL